MCYKQVSAVADKPAGRAASSPLCCTQMWTLSEIKLATVKVVDTLVMVNYHPEFRMADKVPEESTLVSADIRVPFQNNVGVPRVAAVTKVRSIHSAISVHVGILAFEDR